MLTMEKLINSEWMCHEWNNAKNWKNQEIIQKEAQGTKYEWINCKLMQLMDKEVLFKRLMEHES